MGEVNKAKTHKVVMDNRNSLSMTGISKVTSIDPDLVLLVTEQGKFMMGRWKNEWSAGVDWTRFSRDRNNVWSAENTYKIDGNIYENNTSPAPTIVWDPITPHQKMMMRSLAVLDTISSPDERMMFTFGVHWHEVETTNYVNKSYIKSHAASPVPK